MTAFFTHDNCLLHEVPAGHPENPDRLGVLLDHFRDTSIIDDLEIRLSSPASNELLARVHSLKYVEALESASPSRGLVRIEQDTSLSPQSLIAARHAVGATVDAVELVLEGDEKTAFCAVRPPGHHAESHAVLGFCLFNSIAVAADVALDQLSRVAILDFDVHHCNGTVEMFKERSEVLVCSSFQYPFYPGRFQNEDRPNIVNSPLAAGSGSREFRSVVERQWLPALDRHKPELILVSAGFDAHRDDPLANLSLLDDDYRWITNLILDTAKQFANGRIVSTLEGGYNLESLVRNVHEHVAAMH